MDDYETYDNSTNVNSLWLNNIYENLKNLEAMERMAREGCVSLVEYLQIPQEQRIVVIGDAQYRNLKMMISEMHLLLTDLTPVINKEQLEKFDSYLKRLGDVIEIRKMFIKEIYSATKNGVVETKTTELFKTTLTFVSKMRREIINSIASILFIKSGADKEARQSLNW